jgi:hypothetical protein
VLSLGEQIHVMQVLSLCGLAFVPFTGGFDFACDFFLNSPFTESFGYTFVGL